MASSTSNSNAYERANGTPWARLFVTGLLGAVALTAGWEVSWRTQGYQPQIVDSYELWASKHNLLLEENEQGIAFIGASRLMQAIDPSIIREELPNAHPIQLGLAGATPLPVLKFLAEETSFTGTVVVDVTPRILFGEDDFSERQVNEWVNRFREENKQRALLSEPYFKRVERPLSHLLEKNLLVAGNRVSPIQMAKTLIKGEESQPAFWSITEERQQLMDYSGVDTASFLQSRVRLHTQAKRLDEERLSDRLSSLNKYVTELEARGAKILFLRAPTAHGVREAEEELFPKVSYWQRLVAQVNGAKLHCQEIPELTEFPMTDGAHIDSEYSAEFTRRLIPHLKQAIR